MNDLTRSFLYAMAGAVLAWLKQLDETDAVLGWLEAEIEKLK